MLSSVGGRVGAVGCRMATALANGDPTPAVGQVWATAGTAQTLAEHVIKVTEDQATSSILWARTNRLTYQVHRIVGGQPIRVLSNPDPRQRVWPPAGATLVYDPDSLFVQRLIAVDVSVPSDQTYLQRNPVLLDGVSITILDRGELLSL